MPPPPNRLPARILPPLKSAGVWSGPRIETVAVTCAVVKLASSPADKSCAVPVAVVGVVAPAIVVKLAEPVTGVRQVLWVDLIWLAANAGTFLLRFLIFHFLLFADRATVLLQDFRSIRGRFDRVVSIEMIRAVNGAAIFSKSTRSMMQ